MNTGLIEVFAKECDSRAAEIDPDNELDWLSLTVGWAIAKGESPEAATDLALHIRYSTNLG